MLGAGLAMDAFSVSLANGLAESRMSMNKVSVIAGTFAVFQFLMPMIGWFIVHTAAENLAWFDRFVPWIALILLCLIGGKMIKDGLEERRSISKDEGDGAAQGKGETLGPGMLMMQGVATSIDALSVGFTTARYGIGEALLSSLIIGAVTFAICTAGCLIGKKAGTALSWKASVLGGIILIFIGIRIFFS